MISLSTLPPHPHSSHSSSRWHSYSMRPFELYRMGDGVESIGPPLSRSRVGCYTLFGLVELCVVLLELLTPLGTTLVTFGFELIG